MERSNDLAWLKKAISKGLMGMVVLHLDGRPSAETVTKTAGVWFHIIKSWPIDWDEALDKPRLSLAFTALASNARRWPCPAELRPLLPMRKYPQNALPEPDYPPEQAAENLRTIKRMIKEAITK
ncbi:MAG: hypothetical protein Q8K07_10475 [Methylicorpusculum sp.]|uniref:hypothetical protein n=1 Tax=Methylicorpusculum sp. TaxID=2713644 RepID=UPI00272F8FE4|nr:hypothetical protein [Methylicorpusculum sp.]MDP2202433.1 hypothetical protein [Methylicorpusculum sp.]